MFNDIYVVEHSNIQHCFHIDLLDNVLEMNLDNVFEPTSNDYQIIFIGDYNECKKFLNKLEKKLNN